MLASSGMQADMMTLHKTLRMRLVKYQQNHQKDMSLTAASQMLSNMLYTRRFFPYYTFNVLGGIDEKGTLCSFSVEQRCRALMLILIPWNGTFPTDALDYSPVCL